jgi:catechol 2,3-dioxygenase-like lactoylglutathione lyase family enzyme
MQTKAPIVTGIDFVTVPTRNYDAAAEFYGTVLCETIDSGVCHQAFFDLDGNSLGIHHRYAPRAPEG